MFFPMHYEVYTFFVKYFDLHRSSHSWLKGWQHSVGTALRRSHVDTYTSTIREKLIKLASGFQATAVDVPSGTKPWWHPFGANRRSADGDLNCHIGRKGFTLLSS